MNVKIYTLFLLMWMPFLLSSQKYTISGYVEDGASGEKLIGANVFHPNSNYGTTTNTYGYFSLTLDQAGSSTLVFSYIGYQNEEVVIDGLANKVMNIKLTASNTLETIEVTAESSKRIENQTQMSVVDIPIKQIQRIPALMGEVDVLKALQLLPGVQSGGEGQNGLYVRGGSPDQNLILLDGVPVYNASHLFGFFSVFNADAIKDVRLIKGGFPARYGGRLSSVIDINLKEGNLNEFHGDLSVGLISSKLTLEGPISKGKTSFLVSGRRTYIDILTRPIIKKSFEDENTEGGAGYYFYDLNAKVNHKFSDRDRMYLSVYTGDDVFYFDQKDKDNQEIIDFTENKLAWGNITGALRWNHILNEKLFANTTITYSNYKLDTKANFGTTYKSSNDEDIIRLQYISGIKDWAAKFDLDYVPNPNHFIKTGVNIILHTFNPGTFNLEQTITSENYHFESVVGQDIKNASELALYAEDDFLVTKQLKLNTGIHLSGFAVDKKFYTSIQPRISMNWNPNKNWAFKASYATMRQYINLLAFEGAGLPTDLWLPTTERIKPQDSWQVAVGAGKTLSNSMELSVEAYYKNMTNLISYKDGAGVFELTDWQDRITQGNGKSYGLEVFLQKKKGKFSGWLGYTLSWTKRQFDEINNGKEFPYRYDRRHDISLVGSYDISKKINLAATWVFGTGNAVTLSNSKYRAFTNLNPDYNYFTTLETYSDKNGYRMRPYHRLDVGINFVKKKPNRERTWSVGAYNTYGNKNPFYVYFDYDYETDKQVLKQISLFPFIPYVTYSLKF